ncbi:MAG: 6-carboxytetrahydropterin synthase [Acidobacteriota bacterium]|nr:6-carboxytetrahydropterin synthase [Acidobacteriota bacterium]
MFVTRKVEFSASHFCRVGGLSDSENFELFGAESNPNGHGHNYVLEVTIEGDPHPITGMVIDLKRVKEILEQEIVEPMDHRFLNFEVPPFNELIPTTANVAQEIWRRLDRCFQSPDYELFRVRLFETSDLYVDVVRDDILNEPSVGEELAA